MLDMDNNFLSGDAASNQCTDSATRSIMLTDCTSAPWRCGTTRQMPPTLSCTALCHCQRCVCLPVFVKAKGCKRLRTQILKLILTLDVCFLDTGNRLWKHRKQVFYAAALREPSLVVAICPFDCPPVCPVLVCNSRTKSRIGFIFDKKMFQAASCRKSPVTCQAWWLHNFCFAVITLSVWSSANFISTASFSGSTGFLSPHFG